MRFYLVDVSKTEKLENCINEKVLDGATWMATILKHQLKEIS
jgi:hypothetical protein